MRSQVLCTLAIICLLPGCANLLETRAVERFAEGVKKQDLERLKASTSEDFEQKSLRMAESLDDLKILRIPDGKTSIVKTEEVSEDRKRVTVEVKEGKGKSANKREVFYELVRNDKGMWVVDDIFLKQKQKGITAYRSVTEQMDLLLTVREFLSAWEDGTREQVLAVCKPEFRTALDKLPASQLVRLTKLVTHKKSKLSSHKPQAQLDENIAVVRLPRSDGETVISFNLIDDRWLVGDVAIDTKDDSTQIPSAYKQSIAIGRCVDFLAAYETSNKEKLQQICHKRFYDGCLSIANLSDVPLPSSSLPNHELQVKLRGARADFTLTAEKEVIQVSMHRADEQSASDVLPEFLVDEVTIFEADTKQEKHLSSVFTSRAMLELFVDAIRQRNLANLRHASTRDFTVRVWERYDDQTIPGLPLETWDKPIEEILRASYQGAMTKYEVRQSGRTVTYLLREQNGRFFVDDVQIRIPGRPESLKQLLEYMIPVQNFAVAISLGRDAAYQKPALEALQRYSSNDFSRVVWSQTQFVPNSGLSADSFLASRLKSVEARDNEVLITLGDEYYGAEVKLVKQLDLYAIDDVQLVAGPEASQRLPLKHTLRVMLAEGKALPPDGMEKQAKPVVRKSTKSQLWDVQATTPEEPANQPSKVVHVSNRDEFPPAESVEPQPETPDANSDIDEILNELEAMPLRAAP